MSIEQALTIIVLKIYDRTFGDESVEFRGYRVLCFHTNPNPTLDEDDDADADGDDADADADGDDAN